MFKKLPILTLLCLFTSITNSAASSSSTAPRVKTLLDTPELKIVDFTPYAARQEGADCGLHSIKNAWALYNHFSGSTSRETLQKQLKSKSIGQYKDMPACRRVATGATISRLLYGDEVENFAEKVGFPTDQLTVFEDINRPHYNQKEQAKIAQMIEKLQKGEPFVHALVVGNMREITGTRTTPTGETVETVTGTAGHYIGALLRYVPGEALTFYIANSAGENPRVNKELIERLHELLKTLDPTQLRFHEIDVNYNNAQRLASHPSEPEPFNALRSVEDLLISLKTYNLFNDYFRRNYLTPILSLLDRIEPFLLDEQKERLENARKALASPEDLLSYQAPEMPSASTASSSSAAASPTPAAASSSSAAASSTSSAEEPLDADIAAALAASRKTFADEQKARTSQATAGTRTRPTTAPATRRAAPARRATVAVPKPVGLSTSLGVLRNRAVTNYTKLKNAGISDSDIAQIRKLATQGNRQAQQIIQILSLPGAKK